MGSGRAVVNKDPAVCRIVRVEHHAEQTPLPRIPYVGNGEERSAEDGAVAPDDADRATLLGDEHPVVAGRGHEGDGLAQA